MFYSHNQELEFGFFRLINRRKFMLFIVFHLVRVQTSLQTDWNAYKSYPWPRTNNHTLLSLCLGPSLDGIRSLWCSQTKFAISKFWHKAGQISCIAYIFFFYKTAKSRLKCLPYLISLLRYYSYLFIIYLSFLKSCSRFTFIKSTETQLLKFCKLGSLKRN